jgi:hypothetical protein
MKPVLETKNTKVEMNSLDAFSSQLDPREEKVSDLKTKQWKL